MTNEFTERVEEQGPITPIWIIKTMTYINVLTYRLTNGRLMNKLGGGPICLIEMTGAKTGKKLSLIHI